MMVLDTNIAIYYFKAIPEVLNFIDRKRARQETLVISSVTVIELLGYPDITAREMFAIEQWLRTILVVDVDITVAREAARIRREHRLKTVDSAIAATAIILKADLVTKDITFQHLRDIKIIAP